MKTRPVPVAAHNVPVFCGARASHATAAADENLLPHAADVSSVEGAPSPILTKSPQLGAAAEVVNSGQFASRYVCSPPQSCVRQTEKEPWKIDPATAALGSGMTGG